MPRPASLLVPFFLAVSAAASFVAWREYRQVQVDAHVIHKVVLLESENDSLRAALATAQRDAADSKNAQFRTQIEHDTSEIRELPFKNKVVYAVLDRAGIRQVVAGKLTDQYTDQDIQNMATGYAALGLLPPNFPLKQTYIDLLGEQIAAFYDQHQHKLFMFQDADLGNSQNRVILSHELTHALQDQNFGLLKLPLEARDNDDRAVAASALVEGDATLEMSQYMVKDLTWKTFADTATYSMTQSMDQIRKAPHFLREMLVFPYLKGQLFCTAVYARGGFSALSAVYANPPASTAQILHPDKYFPETREDPIPVNIPDTTFKAAKPLADNVLGEMGCRILFSQADADAADQIAAGWRGDRYLVFNGGNELVWTTIWRDPGAAASAALTFQSVCDRRFKGGHAEAGPGRKITWPATASRPAHILTTVNINANEVVFILSTTQESSDLLQKQFAGASHG